VKVVIVSKKDPTWTYEGLLMKETETKYCLWTNERKIVEIHFPKETYAMNKIEG